MTAPYYADEDVTLYLGDCLDVIAAMGAASIDAVVTDPPYGLEFMGREWDAPWKPEGRGGNTSGMMPTGYTDGAKRLERPSYLGSPNPTCRNCGGCQRGREGRAIRKCVCDHPDFPNVILPRMAAFQAWCEQWAAECLRVLKPGGHLLAFGGTRTWHRMACAIEDAGFEIRDSIDWIYGSGFPKSANTARGIDRKMAPGEPDPPVSAEGEPWEGWGTALKPAHEPIVVARKPLAGTVAQNVLAYGTGALNIDGCRVGDDTSRGDRYKGKVAHGGGDGWRLGSREEPWEVAAGRWPPNVVLGPAAAAELDRQSGHLVGCGGPKQVDSGDTSMFGFGKPGRTYEREGGGASRFFPVFRYEAKAAAHERPRAEDGIAHPTVKPLDLMRWLVRLVTPPDGLVLDPFAGSGTTAEACIVEGFRCVLVEKDPASAELIKIRLRKPIQPVMFGLDAS